MLADPGKVDVGVGTGLDPTPELLKSDDALASLSEDWGRLDVPSVFLTWEWASTWWRVYGNHRRPWLVAARDGQGQLRALAPLCLTRARVGPLPAGRLLTWMGAEEVCPDHMDLIVPEAGANEYRRTLLEAVWRYRDDWDGLWWTDVPETSETRAILTDWAAEHGMLIEETMQEECSILPLPGGWPELEASMSSHFRNRLRRDERRLYQDLEARVVRCETEGDVPRFVDALERLHGERHAEGGSLRHASFREFQRALAPRLYRRGWLRLALLETPQEPLAASYRFAHRGVTSFYLCGLSGSVSHLSRGKVLLAATIRDAIAEGMREFDFMRGQHGYKDRWTQVRRRTVSLFVAQHSLGGRWASLARAGRRRLRSVLQAAWS